MNHSMNLKTLAAVYSLQAIPRSRHRDNKVALEAAY